ncbi:MAG: HlyD family type I secretion periplasmic adaptor subunit, partial [Rhizobiaceae bacterium]|nr:HlyD family type I secretion periplasmic adaptor subunit [Rhizobiaceae bacterium]
MFGSKIEDEYANNISASAAAARGVSFWPVILLINCGLALFVVWAYFSEIEEITSGQGRVIPSSQLQVVQTLEGGIISAILVAEGDLVEKGQILMTIDDTGFSSKLGELKQKDSSLRAERVRLVSEANFEDALEFSLDLKLENPIAVAAEFQVFYSRKLQLQTELNVLQNRVAQRRAELEELSANESKQNAILVPLRKEADLTIKMFERGVVPEIELLRLQSRIAEIKGTFDVFKAAAPKVEASITEAENTIKTTRNAYVLSARERLAKLEAELAVVNETMRAASDRVSRTQLRAPVRGVVNKVNATTIGAIVQPGRDIIEIVPVDDSLLVEARI